MPASGPLQATRPGHWPGCELAAGALFLLALVVGAGAGLGAVAFPVPDLLLHLAGDRAQRVWPGRVCRQRPPAVARHQGFLLIIPVDRRVVVRTADLLFRAGGPRTRCSRGDVRGRRRRGPDPPPGQRVKALASALCIGGGGSVGREGPIVQIGSALASSIGQWVRMPESRLRILVACGAAGRDLRHVQRADHRGVLRRGDHPARVRRRSPVHRDAVADGRRRHRDPVLGDKPFLSGFPAGIALHHARNYLLVASSRWSPGSWACRSRGALHDRGPLRRAVEGAAGVGASRRRRDRARAVLLALPQMYGVGYPVMNKTSPASTPCGS